MYIINKRGPRTIITQWWMENSVDLEWTKGGQLRSIITQQSVPVLIWIKSHCQSKQSKNHGT